MGHVIAILAFFATTIVAWLFVFANDAQMVKAQALLTPTVAFLAVAIALGQWHIARNKLKLDLFKQRSEVYEATRAAIFDLIAHLTLTRSEQQEFLSKTRGAMWLFDDGVRSFVDDLWQRIVAMDSLYQRIDGVQREYHYSGMTQDAEGVQSAQAALAQLRASQRVHQNWCNDQINNRRVETLFRHFLKIEH